MADAEVATPATDGAPPSSTAESVEQPPPSSVDPPPPTVNGVAEPPAPAAVPAAAVDAAAAEEAPSSSKSGVVGPSTTAAPRIDVSDESETTTLNRFELHDKEAESADRVAAALKAARLQVDHALGCIHFYWVT